MSSLNLSLSLFHLTKTLKNLKFTFVQPLLSSNYGTNNKDESSITKNIDGALKKVTDTTKQLANKSNVPVVYPEKITYRKQVYDRPLDRVAGIIKEDIEEMYESVKFHYKAMNSDELSNVNFNHFKKQIFPHMSDVVIIGGGLVGLSCAYHLQEKLRLDNELLRVVVIEKDFSYTNSSSKLSCGGIRQQFLCPENMILSRYGMDFIQMASRKLKLQNNYTPKLDLNLQSHLFLANEEQMPFLEESYLIQKEYGCFTNLLSKDDIKSKFPWMCVDDIVAGTIGTQREGWLDPFRLTMALGRKIKDFNNNTDIIEGEVVSVEIHNVYDGEMDDAFSQQRVRSVQVLLPDGELREIKSSLFVIAAGSASQHVGLQFGIGDQDSGMRKTKIPVEPRKKYFYNIKSPGGPGLNCPVVIDTDGITFRRDGLADMYLCTKSGEMNLNGDFSMSEAFFHDVIAPSITKRFPGIKNNFELQRSWCCNTDYNTFDQNAIIGKHPSIYNAYIATGFGGNGAQHAIGAGKAISELLFEGKYVEMNFERLNFERVLVKEPVYEMFV